jgi:transposase
LLLVSKLTKPYISHLRQQYPLDLSRAIWDEEKEEQERKEEPLAGQIKAAKREVEVVKVKAIKVAKQPKERLKTEPGGTSLPSLRRMAWWFVVEKEKVPEKQQGQLQILVEQLPEIGQTYHLAQEFGRMLRERDGKRLEEWLVKVGESKIGGLISFGHGIERDKVAVKAGLSLKWNNGTVEGGVNRLKFIKRSGYGRAKFDLLRKRVLIKTAA